MNTLVLTRARPSTRPQVTHQGPYENLCAHLSNPTGANILTNFGAIGGN